MSPARTLKVGNLPVHWSDIVQLYIEDKQRPGLRMLPKLTSSHVNPNHWERMRVRYATQVLSASVADQLNYKMVRHGRSELAATRDYVLTCNDLFDILNGTEPIRSAADARLQQARDILAWFQHQAAAAKAAQQAAGKDAKPQWLADCTQYDVSLAIEGFCGYMEDFFRVYPGNFTVPRRFNQDAVENFFGQVRASGRGNKNPNVAQFGDKVQRIIVSGLCKPSSKYNSGSQDTQTQILLPLQSPYRKQRPTWKPVQAYADEPGQGQQLAQRCHR